MSRVCKALRQRSENMETIPSISNYQSLGLSADVLVHHIRACVIHHSFSPIFIEHLTTAKYGGEDEDTICDRYC